MDRRDSRHSPVTILDLFSRPLVEFGDDADSIWQGTSSSERFDKIKIDVEEFAECYVLKADLPGARKEDIVLDFADNVLSIKAPHHQESESSPSSEGAFLVKERVSGVYGRRLGFEDIDASGIDASFDNGVLTVMLPKVQRRAARSSIQIN
ncbi:MAG: Hsp20 family protein [Proteobacteria bacterium]|uniref:Hsp20 family protein n=1 Tax=Candidatus Avisuccinivibrio stercorigallinarum TaxID=2840704 RepID=A0A9D9GTR4_9GAMM|nr:Hsp20 family protein [Candidatus Avisuccinivibrio stercorigallinarum]